MKQAPSLSRADTPSLTEQLQRGFHGLRFEGELETAYRRDQFYERLRYLRINLAILAAISILVIQVDRVVVPIIVGSQRRDPAAPLTFVEPMLVAGQLPRSWNSNKARVHGPTWSTNKSP